MSILFLVAMIVGLFYGTRAVAYWARAKYEFESGPIHMMMVEHGLRDARAALGMNFVALAFLLALIVG